MPLILAYFITLIFLSFGTQPAYASSLPIIASRIEPSAVSGSEIPVLIRLEFLEEFTGIIEDTLAADIPVKQPLSGLTFQKQSIGHGNKKVTWDLSAKKGDIVELSYLITASSSIELGPLLSINTLGESHLLESSPHQLAPSAFSTLIMPDIEPVLTVSRHPLSLIGQNSIAVFTLQAKQDFSGVVKETLPSAYELSPVSGYLPFDHLLESDHIKTLTWYLNLKKGQTAKIAYSFSLPSGTEVQRPSFGPLTALNNHDIPVYTETSVTYLNPSPPTFLNRLITIFEYLQNWLISIFRPSKIDLSKHTYKYNENIEITLRNADPGRLRISLLNEGLEIPASKQINSDSIIIEKPRSFRPGKYQLRITDGFSLDYKQDFTWGVLAVNTNKSVYLPGETADISLAVLDEFGAMVCDSDLELKITSPNMQTTTLSTADSSIIVNPECQIHNYTEKPDYQTTYQVGPLGTYRLELTAKTKNGTYQISDAFETKASVDFDLSRTLATRIFPTKPYPVHLTLIANRDFVGTIEESVPSFFKISPLKGSLTYTGISRQGDTQKINWNLVLKKGDKVNFGYTFDAPDISPEFYLLGPIRFIEAGGMELFRESRQWQIASDAVAKMLLYWDGTSSNIPSGWSCVSCGTTDPYYQRFIRGGTSISNVGGTEFHVHPDPGTITSGAVDVGTTIRGSTSTASVYAPINTHTHTTTVVGSGLTSPNLPAFIDLLVIQYDAGIPQSIPSGAIGLFDSAPSGSWSSVYDDNQYIRGNGTTNTTIQSANTHTHSITTLTTSIQSVGTTYRGPSTGTRYVAGIGHSHPPGTGTSSSGNHEPPYHGSILAKTSSLVAYPSGLIAMFTDVPPASGWTLLSDSSGKDYYQRFAKMTNDYNSGSSDSSSHSHTVSITTGAVTIPNTRMGTTNTYRFGRTNHTHTFSNISIGSTSHLPPYREAIFAKSGSSPSPDLQQIHYHWRHDNGSEATALSQTSGIEDSNPVSSDPSVNHRLRVEISNEGNTAFAGAQFRLEYGLKSTTCSAISTWVDVGALGGDWDMSNSTNLTHGSDTTNVGLGASGGVSDANPTFLTANGGVLDTSSTSSSLTLTYEDFVELEYSIKANVISGNYCFRVSNAGSDTNFTYNLYPEASVQTAGISLSGTCKQADLTSECTDTGTIRVAYDDQLQTASQSTVAGTWSIIGLPTPDTGQLITVYIQGADDSQEAVAVSKYDGSGNITNLNLIESFLSIGSTDNPTISNQDLNIYDYSSSGSNEDIFYEVNGTSGDLDTCTASSGSCSVNGLYVGLATYRPASSGSVGVTAHHFYPHGTLTMDANSFYISGDWNAGSSGTVSANTSQVIFNGASYTTQSLLTSTTFYDLSIQALAPRTFRIGAGTSQAASHNLEISGADCQNLLLLRSTASGNHFQFSASTSGTVNRQYLDVQDLEGINGTLTFQNSVDSGNNSSVSFGSNSCLGASTNQTATAYGFQRKTFYDSVNENYWQLYHDGTEIEVRYSSDGSTWSSATSLPYNTNDFSIWHQSIGSTQYLFVALTSGYDILLRRGQLSANSVSWDSAANLTPFNGSASNNSYSLPSVSLDSSGYPWLTARHYNGSTYSLLTITGSSLGNSDFSSFTWDQPQTFQASVGSSQVYAAIAPLSDQNMYSVFASDASLYGCFWNHSTGSWLNSSDSSCIGSGSVPESYSISTSTSTNAIAANYQRKNWYDGSRYWSAFNSNNRIEFWYSSDGITWTENTSARISSDTNDFSISADSSGAYIVYSVSDTAYVRQSSSYPSTSFSWGSPVTVHQPGSSPSIIRDTNDHLWVSLLENQSADPDFSDGFESGGFSGWDGHVSNGVGTTNEVTSSSAYSGSYGIHQSVVNSTNGWGYVYKDITIGSGDEIYAVYRFRRNSITSNGYAGYATFFNDPGYVRTLGHITYSNTDYIVIRKKDGTDTLVPFTDNLSNSQWYEIALSADYSGTNPVFKVFVDGDEQATYTDTSSGTQIYPDNFIAGTQEITWNVSTDVYYDSLSLYSQDPFAGSGRSLLAIGSSSANNPSAWVTPALLKNSQNSNLSGLIVPRNSGSIASIWQDSDSIEANLFVGTTWASSATNIATGSTKVSHTISAVGDTASGNLHLSYIDPSGSLKYLHFIDTWGTAVTLDTGTSNHSPVISIGIGTTDSLYLSWFNHQSLYRKKSTYPYGSSSWDSTPKSILTAASNYSLSSSYYFENYPLLTWVSGSSSPYLVSTYLDDSSWYDSSWTYRSKIVINNAQIGTTASLSDFVMLLSSTNPEWKSTQYGGWVAQNDGGDFIFTTGIGGTKLDHEIESYNPETGDLVAWIKIPQISKTKENRIYLYYGNSGCTDQWNTDGSVWTSSYQAVWHLTEDQSGVGSTDIYLDSSGNNNHIDDYITSTSKPPAFAAGQGFSASNSDYLTAGYLYFLSGTTSFTLSAWVKRTTTSTYSAFIGKQNAAGNAGEGIILFSDGNLYFGVSNGAIAYGITPLNDTNWHHLVMVYDGTGATNADRLKGYVDGSAVTLNFGGTTIPSQAVVDTTPFEMGRQIPGSYYATGSVDEVRLLSGNLDQYQISTEFQNQSSPSTFYTISAGISAPPGFNPDTIDTAIPGNTYSAFSLVSDGDTMVSLAYLDDESTNQIAYKSLSIGGTWTVSPVAIKSSDNAVNPSLSLNSDTNDPYLFWIDISNQNVLYRSCSLSESSSNCAVGGDWESETSFRTSAYNQYLNTSFSAPSLILTQMSVGSSSPVTVFWDYLNISSSTNQTPSAPSLPYINNNNTSAGHTTPVFGLTDHTPAFSAIFDDPDLTDTAAYYQIEVNTASDFSGTSLWDSGQTAMAGCSENTRCADITYSGDPLLDANTYYWHIKFWDNSGSQSPWSAVQQFSLNDPPQISNLILNNSSDIELIENEAVGISWVATATDTDGSGDMITFSGKLFRSGVDSGENCTPDFNNCYNAATCNTAPLSGTSLTVTCSADVYFFAEPTDSDSIYASESWLAKIQAIDSKSEVGSTQNSPGAVDLLSYSSLDVGATMVYGELMAGQNTGSSNRSVVLVNTGNRSIDSEIKGTDLCADQPCSNFIPADVQQFNLNSFTYGTGTTLSTAYQTVLIGLSKPTQYPSDSTKNLYWGISIPSGITAGTYSGAIEIYAYPR